MENTKKCTACNHELPLDYFDNLSDRCYLCDTDDVNPYILSGDELERTEKARKQY